MRIRFIAAGFTIILALVTESAGPAAAATSAATVVRGQAQVTLESYDYCGGGGSRRFAGRTTYRVPAEFRTGPRKSFGGLAERNPFSWTMHIGPIGSTGSFQLASAAVAKPPGVLLNYWTSTYNRSSGRFSGRLVTSHADKATAYNTFFGQQYLIACRPSLGTIPMVYALRPGSRINGVVTGRGARLTLTGSTGEGFYAFRVDFSA
jgi:hypothetical protein